MYYNQYETCSGVTNTKKTKLNAVNKKDDHHRELGDRVARVLNKVPHRSRAFYFLNSKTNFDYVLYNE